MNVVIKAVIFDLDGVIVSTDALHYQAWKKMADKEGIYFDEDINNQLKGISRMDSLMLILQNTNKKYSLDELESLLKFKNDIYVNLLEKLAEKDILPGMVELINKLIQSHVKIAIGSSSRNAKKILEKVKLISKFDAISDGTNISKSKPDPEVFLKAAEMLRLDPRECVVVEDARSGIKAAKAAGMITFAVGDAKRSKLKDYDLEEIYQVLHLEE